MKIFFKGGSVQQPQMPAVKSAVAPNPDEEDAELKKKRDEATAAEKSRLSGKRGNSRTIATSPLGVLGAAPVNKPELQGSLGGTQY